MRAVVVIALLSALSACSMRNANRAGLAVMTSSIACDWRQTRSLAEADWPAPYREANPMLGREPSTARVDTYFAAFEIAAVVAWRLLPERLRPLLWAPIAANQIRAVNHNRHAVSACNL